MNPHIISRWKNLDLEITDSEYHHDLTYTGEIIPSQTLNLKHVEIIKVSDKPINDTSFEMSWLGDHRFWVSGPSDILMWNYIISNLKPWKSRSYKVSDKRAYDLSLERPWLGDRGFWILLWSNLHRWIHTISNLKVCCTWILFYYARR